RPETQGKALEAARKAVELDPESRTYQYGLANLLLNNNRAAEAEEVGKRLLASAATEQDEAAAKRLLATIAEEKAWEAESSEDMDGTAASAGGAADKAESNGSARGSSVKAARPATAARRLPTPDWMALDGEIVGMECGRSPEITITLAMPKGPMAFHAK